MSLTHRMPISCFLYIARSFRPSSRFLFLAHTQTHSHSISLIRRPVLTHIHKYSQSLTLEIAHQSERAERSFIVPGCVAE
eukprot:216236-Pyramimonas_sp.AAC.1